MDTIFTTETIYGLAIAFWFLLGVVCGLLPAFTYELVMFNRESKSDE